MNFSFISFLFILGDLSTGRGYVKAATAMNVIGPVLTLIVVLVIVLMYFGVIAGLLF